MNKSSVIGAFYLYYKYVSTMLQNCNMYFKKKY